jgi:hypothetical protein
VPSDQDIKQSSGTNPSCSLKYTHARQVYTSKFCLSVIRRIVILHGDFLTVFALEISQRNHCFFKLKNKKLLSGLPNFQPTASLQQAGNHDGGHGGRNKPEPHILAQPEDLSQI